MIEVNGLTKKFGEFTAVNSISFQIGQGEVVGLLGPNGAGKTTTMRMLTGYYDATAGSIRVGDYSLPRDRQEIQRSIGYLPESASSYSDMLVIDFLAFSAQARGLNREEQQKGLEKAIEATDISHYLYHPIHKLSKGYRQRTGLAAALVHDPQILILDEPTSGLDPNQIVEIQNLIKSLAEEKTIILSTHILQEIEAVARRAMIIARGELVLDKPLSEITHGSDQNVFVSATFSGDARDIATALQQKLELSETPQGAFSENETTFRIAGDTSLSHRIFRAAADNQWQLTELYREKRSLEDVFQQITGGKR